MFPFPVPFSANFDIRRSRERETMRRRRRVATLTSHREEEEGEIKKRGKHTCCSVGTSPFLSFVPLDDVLGLMYSLRCLRSFLGVPSE